MSGEERGHIVPHATLVKVWLVLLALTAVLVLASRLPSDPGSGPPGPGSGPPAAATWAMLCLTPVKAGLVFYFFMHLKYEKILLQAMVFTALSTLVIFIAMLFLDISFRL